MGGVDDAASTTAARSRERGSTILTLRNNLIALGLDPDTGQQDGTLNALGFDLQHSTADNLLNARRGYQIAFHAEQAGRIVPGTFNYYAVSVDARHYLPIGGRWSSPAALQFGNIRRRRSTEPSNVPFSKKYFLGGATSVRGWGRYEVSPLSGSGLPIGGNSMLAFSEELRAQLRGNFGAVLFIDAGNVWADSWDIDLTRPALRRRSRASLSDADRTDPLRFRAISSIRSRPAGRTASRSRAAGAFTSASARLSRVNAD